MYFKLSLIVLDNVIDEEIKYSNYILQRNRTGENETIFKDFVTFTTKLKLNLNTYTISGIILDFQYMYYVGF